MSSASDLARGLGQNAEAACRNYLPKGRRQGRYWLCGDVHGTPGRSLYVQLFGERAGKYTDGATGEHGDLLDLIMANRGLDFRAACDEARAFLRLSIMQARRSEAPAPPGTSEAARRLFAASGSIRGTLPEAYLCQRGIACPRIFPPCVSTPDASIVRPPGVRNGPRSLPPLPMAKAT